MSEVSTNKKFNLVQWYASGGLLLWSGSPGYGILQDGTTYASGRLERIQWFTSNGQSRIWSSGAVTTFFQNFSGYLGYTFTINTNNITSSGFPLYNTNLPVLDAQQVNARIDILQFQGPTTNIPQNFNGKVVKAWKASSNGSSLQTYTSGAALNFFNTFQSGTTYLIESASGSFPYSFYNLTPNQNLPIQQPDAAYVNQSYTYQLSSEG